MADLIHESAVIDDGAMIGDGTQIWHFSHVCSDAVIGDHVSIGQGCFVANGAKIGNKCKIQNNVSIYDGVILEDGVFCGPSVVFTNVYNPRSFVSRKSEYKSTLVKTGATLGANCTIVCGTIIGEYAFIGAGSVVTSDIKNFALVVGVPARQIGWMSAFGETLDLPLEGNAAITCPNTQDAYELKNGELIRHPASG